MILFAAFIFFMFFALINAKNLVKEKKRKELIVLAVCTAIGFFMFTTVPRTGKAPATITKAINDIASFFNGLG